VINILTSPKFGMVKIIILKKSLKFNIGVVIFYESLSFKKCLEKLHLREKNNKKL